MDAFTPLVAALLVSAVVPQVSFCQELTEPASKSSIDAKVAAYAVYDDNLFSRPVPTSDLIWRVSPSATARHRSTRLNVSSFLTLDAERFRRHADLSTPLARVTTSIDATARPTPRTTLIVNSGYANTSTPSDLNATTGLAADRTRGWEWHGGPDVRREVTPVATVAARYQFTGQFLSGGVSAGTHEAGLSITRSLDAQNEIRGRSVSEFFVFHPGTTIPSETMLLGLTHRASGAIALKVDGGVRYTRGSLRPELVAELAQHARNREVAFTYAIGHATAVGVPTLLEVQRAHVEVAYHRGVRSHAAVRGGVFVNKSGTGTARVYQLSASAAQAIAGPLSLAIGYVTDLQRGRVDVLQQPNQRIERNVLSLGLVVLRRPPVPAK